MAKPTPSINEREFFLHLDEFVEVPSGMVVLAEENHASNAGFKKGCFKIVFRFSKKSFVFNGFVHSGWYCLCCDEIIDQNLHDNYCAIEYILAVTFATPSAHKT